MVLVYTLTLLVSSALLFLVQPMFARMALPLLGGSPGVWNTCMVFFQGALLAGYLYAHLSTRWLGLRRQAMLHIGLLLSAVIVLPISIGSGWSPPGGANPVPWLLALLTVSVGLPFFAVAASAPLMQKWFSGLGHASSHDPYFLYAASNAGSMSGLLAYPLLIEPTLDLGQQSLIWASGYAALILMTTWCAALLWRSSRRNAPPPPTPESAPSPGAPGPAAPGPAPAAETSNMIAPVHWMRQLRWVCLAAVPSSLLLGVTTYITSDLAVAPLLWVLPLALYLLTFILVFAKRRIVPQAVLARMAAVAVVVLMVMLLIDATQPILVIVAAHLAAFFVLAMACHGELAHDRPHAQHLTGFYLMLGLGGVLGGAFNALLAPLVFSSVAEYPIALAAAALLVVGRGNHVLPRQRWRDAALAGTVGAIALALLLMADHLDLVPGPGRFALIAGVPAVGCYMLSTRGVPFAMSVGLVFAVGTLDSGNHGHVLHATRSFYGVHRVTQTDDLHQLFHGTTLHGQQRIDPVHGRPIQPDEPLAYYHRDSPIAQMFTMVQNQTESAEVGIVGLGVGAVAAYARPGDRFTFFEIDQHVQDIAEDESHFTFLAAARQRGATVSVTLGDARLTLAQQPPESFDLLVLDAFSSDSIPVHLLTREAFELYLQLLKPRGIMVVHISNRHLDLQPVLASAARELNLVCMVRDDTTISNDERARSRREGSVWSALSRQRSDLAALNTGPADNWWLDATDRGAAVWTDAYSNIFSAIRFDR